jgi:hypothetical protein
MLYHNQSWHAPLSLSMLSSSKNLATKSIQAIVCCLRGDVTVCILPCRPTIGVVLSNVHCTSLYFLLQATVVVILAPTITNGRHTLVTALGCPPALGPQKIGVVPVTRPTHWGRHQKKG